jgi:hypothetical protein
VRVAATIAVFTSALLLCFASTRIALADPPRRLFGQEHLAVMPGALAAPALVPAMAMAVGAPRSAAGAPHAPVAFDPGVGAIPLPLGPATPSARATDAVSAAEVIYKISSLQFLSATLIPARKEYVPTGDGHAITQITSSLRVAPTLLRQDMGARRDRYVLISARSTGFTARHPWQPLART